MRLEKKDFERAARKMVRIARYLEKLPGNWSELPGTLRHFET